MRLLFKSTSSIVMLGLMISCFAGCNQSAVPKPTVGLIDVDLVLSKTGRLKMIEAELRKKNNDIQSSLKLIEKGLLSSLQEKQKSFGEKPTPEQEKALQQEAMQAQQMMLAKNDEMKRDYDAFLLLQREKYITNEINPVIQGICQEKGFYMVLLKSQAIVHDKTIDITDEVIAKFGSMPEQPVATSANPVQSPNGDAPKTDLPKSKPMPSGNISANPPSVPALPKPSEPAKPAETAPTAPDSKLPEIPQTEAKPDTTPAQPPEMKAEAVQPTSKPVEIKAEPEPTPAPAEKN